MNAHIEQIQQNIQSLRQRITNHKVYASIQTIEDLQIFMQSHIYAVWDFMSLLKALQRSLTCISIPWFPNGDAETRYLINEIVLGEESDIDEEGKRTSHFELYLSAMEQSGADTSGIKTFLSALADKRMLEVAFSEALAPEKARQFVNYTFDKIADDKSHVLAAIFTFGREDLIPDMFHSIVKDLDYRFPQSITKFKYYLERHIEVDGEHHSLLALSMTSSLCGQNEALWHEAEQEIIKSLQMRIELWDGVYDEIVANKKGLLHADLNV